MAHFQDAASRPYPSLWLRAGRNYLTLLLSLSALCVGIGKAQAQDGMSVLLKTMKMYQSLNSYSGNANVDTMMIDPKGQTVKHIGSASVMKFQRPNKIYLYFQTPIGSRKIYSDGTNFSLYDAQPNQYFTIPAPHDTKGLLDVLLARADVAAGLDPLFFLTQNALPKALTNIKLKESTTYNGHAVFVVTGTTNATPVVIKQGNSTTTIPPSYWTWWIDRNSYLLYKVETRTPNIIKPVSFNAGQQHVVKYIKGTLFLRHTVSELKPDVNLQPADFAFTKPQNATLKQTAADVLGKKGK